MNILLDGMFYSGHGFAEGNRVLLRMLDEAGYNVRILPRDWSDKNLALTPDEKQFIASFENTVLPSNDLYLCNWTGPKVRYNPDYRINITRTTFETDRIPASWVPELNRFDEVWVQCKFNLTTFAASGVNVPLRLVPNFFEVDQYSPRGERLPLPIEQSFLFLSVFDMQSRKGYDLLIRAFLDEFSRSDDVALVIKIREPSASHLLESIAAGHPKPTEERPPIFLVAQMLSTPELLGLYRACSAFVLPTRGEGWGRSFFEAMLLEKPVIGTNWSGQTEYMTEMNSYLVEVEQLVRIDENDIPIFTGHYWAEPSMADLKKKMRQVFGRPDEARERGRRARRELLDKFNIRSVARKVRSEIEKYIT
ncbi:glycosyltransferase [Paenibacillus oceani]|uniref:Glycosyltransferase n=1 Tax=Paenibacillus oceani TaxID=2772510 RepID=A0A927C4Y1_9BACL|nr:glycosyltransferase [Paenibacillus oceani]MBD2860889.1 glycosyltransferase [Paenibacillus oceani]